MILDINALSAFDHKQMNHYSTLLTPKHARETSASENGKRQPMAGIAILCVLPAFYAGLCVGWLADGIAIDSSLMRVFLHAIVCASVPALLAFFMPRHWLIPAIPYAFGFLWGYSLNYFIIQFVNVVVQIPFYAIFGIHAGIQHAPEQSELPWLFIFAAWLAAFIGYLRDRNDKAREDCWDYVK